MTTEPSTHPTALDPVAVPYGVAPLAVAPPARRGRSRRRRVLDAAIVSSTLASLPLASSLGRIEDAHRASVVAAVSAIDGADHGDATAEDVLAGLELPGASGSPTDVAPAAPAERAPTGDATPAPGVTAAAVEEGITPVPAPQPAEPSVIAEVDGVELITPSAETVLVGFHEASKPGTRAMRPMARLDADLTSKPVPTIDHPVEHRVSPVVVLPSRARPQAATSAIDIAIPEGEDVVAPVTGKVVMASPYSLYGRYPDWRLEIEPDGHPGTRVILIHVEDVQVEVGDRVVAGETVLAGSANAFPFESQIDRFAIEESGSAHPHVHVEVKRPG